MEDAGGIENLMKQKAESSEFSGTRMAFLDLMLDMLNKGELDLPGIQEEVDTFTFEVGPYVHNFLASEVRT